MKFIQKPLTVDAFRYGIDLWPDWFQLELKEGKARILDAGDDYVIPSCVIDGERPLICIEGDYLVRFPDGETITLSPKRFRERFAEEENVSKERTSSTVSVNVPTMLTSVYGDSLMIDLHFVHGSCHPHFIKGFEQDKDLREAVIEAIYASECFQPLTEEGAAALVKGALKRYLQEATQLEMQ